MKRSMVDQYTTYYIIWMEYDIHPAKFNYTFNGIRHYISLDSDENFLISAYGAGSDNWRVCFTLEEAAKKVKSYLLKEQKEISQTMKKINKILEPTQ